MNYAKCFFLYRVSQKKLGFVFRVHFRPLRDQKSKKARKQTSLKFNFIYQEGFSSQFVDCRMDNKPA